MAQTIRTCSVALLLLLAPGLAQAKRSSISPSESYVQGRAYDAAGQPGLAAGAYAAALTAAPGDLALAHLTFRQAIEAGNKPLALRAAQLLDSGRALPQDGRLLLMIAALERGDWRGARLQIDELDQSGFDFLVPILGGWISLAASDGDPIDVLGRIGMTSLGGVYAREHRIHLLLAAGRKDEAVAGLRMVGNADGRQHVFRLAAAASLASLGEREAALDILDGGDALFLAAKARIGGGESLEGGASSALQGIALLLVRISSDLNREASAQTALSLARLASFADPSSELGRLVLGRALARTGHSTAALEELERIEGLWASQARAARIDVLDNSGRQSEALKLAEREAAVLGADASVHLALAEHYARQKRHREAATSFKSAIDAAGATAGWQSWLYYGGALDLAGDWPAARAALQKAAWLAPDQPIVLNHLGYAMLERREGLAEATSLIARASMLDPDNVAITDSLGWAFFLRGQTREAIALLERALADGAAEAEINEHLGDAYWQSGRRVEARYAWNAALTLSDEESASARITGKIASGMLRRP